MDIAGVLGTDAGMQNNLDVVQWASPPLSVWSKQLLRHRAEAALIRLIVRADTMRDYLTRAALVDTLYVVRRMRRQRVQHPPAGRLPQMMLRFRPTGRMK
jgi:hypothetical protein